MHWSANVISGIKPQFTPWVEAGESYIAQRDINWLAQNGYIVRKSSIWEQFVGRKK